MVYNIYTKGPRSPAGKARSAEAAKRGSKRSSENNGLGHIFTFAVNMVVYEIAKRLARGGSNDPKQADLKERQEESRSYSGMKNVESFTNVHQLNT